jgi:phosphatidylinositol alpha 1,6-mannosyltransferase
MRIAFFSEVYWPMVSGVSLTLARTVDALRQRGHAVRVYTASYSLPDGDGDRPEVHRSPSQPFLLSPEVQWATPDQRAIEDDLARFAPDIVHVATEFPIGFAGLRAARRLRRPVVISAHTDYEEYASRYRVGWAVAPGWVYLRWFYRQAAAVLAPTEQYAERLRRRGVGRVGVWTRGIDTERFAPSFRSARYRRDLGIGPDELVVAYVGRIAPEKGIDRLLDAWEIAAALHPKAHLVFTGSGSMEPAVRER